MSKSPQVEWPTGPARLTDIAVRGKSPASTTGRKSGDLTNHAVVPVAEMVARVHRETASWPHARAASDVTTAPEQSAIPRVEQAATVVRPSDVFDFKNLGGDNFEITSGMDNDSELLSRRSPVPILFHPGEWSDDSSSEPSSVEVIPPGPARVTAAVTIESGLSATAWSLVEQSHPARTSPALDAEVHPMRAGAANDLVTINDPRESGREPHVTDRASLPQIITMVMGALLIIAGVALVAAPMWHEAQLRSVAMTPASDVRDVIRLDDFRAKLPIAAGWFGLAFILVGAALEVIGLRTRRIT